MAFVCCLCFLCRLAWKQCSRLAGFPHCFKFFLTYRDLTQRLLSCSGSSWRPPVQLGHKIDRKIIHYRLRVCVYENVYSEAWFNLNYMIWFASRCRGSSNSSGWQCYGIIQHRPFTTETKTKEFKVCNVRLFGVLLWMTATATDYV